MQTISAMNSYQRSKAKEAEIRGGKPRRGLSAYNIYFRTKKNEAQERFFHETGKKPNYKILSQLVAAKWKHATVSEKADYDRLAAEDKRRYAIELVRWKRQEEGKLAKTNGTNVSVSLSDDKKPDITISASMQCVPQEEAFKTRRSHPHCQVAAASLPETVFQFPPRPQQEIPLRDHDSMSQMMQDIQSITDIHHTNYAIPAVVDYPFPDRAQVHTNPGMSQEPATTSTYESSRGMESGRPTTSHCTLQEIDFMLDAEEVNFTTDMRDFYFD